MRCRGKGIFQKRTGSGKRTNRLRPRGVRIRRSSLPSTGWSIEAKLLDSTVDRGALAALAAPVTTGTRRVPASSCMTTALIRLLDNLLYTGGLLGDWTMRQLHERIVARHRLGEGDYTLAQLRYDLSKLRAHGLAERVGRSRRYRLTPDGVRLGALLVKIRTRLLGPIFADPTLAPKPRSENRALWKPRCETSTEPSTRSAQPSDSPKRPPDRLQPWPTDENRASQRAVVCTESALRPDKAANESTVQLLSCHQAGGVCNRIVLSCGYIAIVQFVQRYVSSRYCGP